MANEEQLSILKQGVEVWNKWWAQNRRPGIDFTGADLKGGKLSSAHLVGANFTEANLMEADLTGSNLAGTKFIKSNLAKADLSGANLRGANFSNANLNEAAFWESNLNRVNLTDAELMGAFLVGADLSDALFAKANLWNAQIGYTTFANSDLRKAIGLAHVIHEGPSKISIDTFSPSNGKIPKVFLRGCGLSDWEIEYVKLYNGDLSNNAIKELLRKLYELRDQYMPQISNLFISYSHADSRFVDQLENQLYKKGVRFWRDTHDGTAGRLEAQIDRAIRQNPTILLVLSKHSLSSDWVEHEVRTARELEKEMGRDVLCPVALDDSWKSSRWPKRVMEQIMEYNILDFSKWQDDSQFDSMFRRLIDGLELFYKG